MTDEVLTGTCLYGAENGSKQANTDRIQIEKIRNNNDRWIKILKILNYSGSKRILSKMMDTSYVLLSYCLTRND